MARRRRKTISEVTRRDIMDFITVERVPWAGRLDERAFLGRLWDLSEMPSDDPRFDDAAGRLVLDEVVDELAELYALDVSAERISGPDGPIPVLFVDAPRGEHNHMALIVCAVDECERLVRMALFTYGGQATPSGIHRLA